MNTTLKKPVKIQVDHVARVEGHGNIKIGIEDGKLIECTWEVVETPRFFEVMFKGLSIDIAPLLAARVCGICSISHALTSARAAEAATATDPWTSFSGAMVQDYTGFNTTTEEWNAANMLRGYAPIIGGVVFKKGMSEVVKRAKLKSIFPSF